MLAYLVQRLLQSVMVMLAVAAIGFSMFRFVGDPVHNIVGQQASAADRERLRGELGLNDSIPVQFARFIGNAVQGEFGVSYRVSRPVKQLIAERLPATIELSLVAVVIALALGVPLGVYTALKPDHWSSSAMLTGSLIGISLPTFLTGIILILLFSVTLGWLPAFGRGEVVRLGWWTTGFFTVSGLKSLVMPAVTLGLFQMTLIMRLVRAEMLEVLRTDFIRFARARGLTDRAVHFGHALKNTLLPVITIAGLQFGSIVAFSIIVETVFQWPGMGQMCIQAIQFSDIPTIAAYLVMIAFIFVVVNLVVDLLYFAVDPRLRADKLAATGGAG